jgi:hypothetical protein
MIPVDMPEYHNCNTVFCNNAIALLHSSGINTARKQAEKVAVWHEDVRYCVTHRQQ